MKIGVVSDTHNNLKNVRRIVELFNAAAVERIVHTGDITQAKTLDAFADLDAPLFGVYGNNDLERDALEGAVRRHGFRISDPPLHLAWAERELVVVHDPRDLDTLQGGAQVALHGHTHRHRVAQSGGALIFNPGECAGHMPGSNAVGLLDLATLETELLRF